MAKRSNHYDVAFESLLRMVRRPYVAVDETRRALHRDSSLKSMDFVVYSQTQSNLLIDVKGRRFPPGRNTWENWIMRDDVESLLEWEQIFGDGFRSLLVFAYEVTSPEQVVLHDLTWNLRGRQYAFYGVWTRDYAKSMRQRSPSWKTVNLRSQDFHDLKQPVLCVL